MKNNQKIKQIERELNKRAQHLNQSVKVSLTEIGNVKISTNDCYISGGMLDIITNYAKQNHYDYFISFSNNCIFLHR